MKFTNKVFIVTGAAGYLASSFVDSIIEEGGMVYALDINKKILNLVNSRRDKKFSKNVYNYKIDITNENEVKNFFFKKKKLDGVINAAAIDPKIGEKSLFNKFTNYSLKNWDLSIKVSLNGTFLISKYACKIFEKKNKGNIINIASTYGIVAPDQRIYSNKNFTKRLYKPLEYPTSKHAIIGFTKSLAAYYHNTQIRVNTLSPGGVEKDQSKKFKDNYNKKTITGRMSKKTDYKGVIKFLLSEESNYLTGSNIVVDGGWSAI